MLVHEAPFPTNPIGVFPLPGCVLLPTGCLPLHIFEPRYCQLTRNALAGDRCIAIGMFHGEVTQHEYYHGRPQVRSVVCIGTIEQHRHLDDGRYLLLLRGRQRARIIEEVNHRPYRRCRMEPLYDRPCDARTMAARAETIRTLLREPAVQRMRCVKEAQACMNVAASASGLADMLTHHLCDDPETRYELLAEPDPAVRLGRLVEHLQALRQSVMPQHVDLM